MIQRLTVAVFVLVLASPLAATQVKVFSTQSQSAFAAGTLEGISIDPLGILQLAHRVERLTAIQEPFLLSAAPHPDGWVLGTGNAGRVLLVNRQGEVSELFAADEPEIFAVWADGDGTIYAAGSPDGKVYRFANGEAQVFFDPEPIYIWSLARDGDGSLLVATGLEAKLFRVDAEGRGEAIYDSDDTHLRVIKTLPGGETLIGTAGEGLVQLLTADGTVRTLYDASQPEVVAFATTADGHCYVAALESEAGFVDLSQRAATRQTAGTTEEENGGEPQPKVTVVTEGEEAPPSVGSRRPGATGPRSEILRVSPEGLVESVWQFQDETVYSLLWYRDRLWVGTGLEGKIYSYRDGKMILEKDVDERQVVGLLPDRPGPAFATTNAAALYRLSGETESEGVYTSPVLDAGQMARFGSLSWRGELPKTAQVRFSARSGSSSEPDRTWSPWSEPKEGREISIQETPRGRYLQWRVELSPGEGRSPRISGVEVSYLQDNLRPKIASLSVMDAGQILVPGNFNPASQVFEPAHPNREGIFTTLEAAGGALEGHVKTLWKKGYRTLRWSAEDPNEDELEYTLSFRRDQDGEAWLPMASEIKEPYYSFDATVLPDGHYRFRLVASDRPGNHDGDAQIAEAVSEPVAIDHSPPRLVSATRRGEGLRVEVEDRLSPLREAVVSVDAKEWQPAEVADGLLDGRREELIITDASEARLLLVRLMDASFNVVTLDLTAELE